MRNKHYLESLNMPSDINNPRIMTYREIMINFGLTDVEARSVVDMNIFRGKTKPVKLTYSDLTAIDVNEILIQQSDSNMNRKYFFDKMFDNVYFELARWLTDGEISTLMAELTEYKNKQSWVTWLNRYQIKMGERALQFIKQGKLILCTEALYRHYTPKWSLEEDT